MHTEHNDGSPFLRIGWPFQLPIAIALLMTGCIGASSFEKEAQRKYSRLGESMIFPFSGQGVSNAIVTWAQTLTNGYSLYDNAKVRQFFTVFKDDLSTVFVSENRTNAISPWGRSACLAPSNSLYWARVVIRMLPVSGGHQVSVAIHGRHFKRGLSWNIHTLKLDREKDIDLPPCPQDERQVLDEIQSALK